MMVKYLFGVWMAKPKGFIAGEIIAQDDKTVTVRFTKLADFKDHGYTTKVFKRKNIDRIFRSTPGIVTDCIKPFKRLIVFIKKVREDWKHADY